MTRLSTLLCAGLLMAFLISDYHASAQPCEDGLSDGNLCLNVHQYKFFPSEEIGGGIINDNWGWVSPITTREYAIQGRSNGTSFFDVSDPANAVYLGNLPTHDFEILWRDIKVYNNHAFVVAESGGHGMQVFNLLQLDDIQDPPVLFEESAHYPGFGNAHNVAINEETGYAYVVGSNTYAGGLHFVNIQDPLNPQPAGGFDEDGYTHDVQVVVYQGPDADYFGSEIAFASNENTVTIVDVTNKDNPQMLAREPYEQSAYTHQGWLTEDHRYFLVNDELDEANFGHNTRTYVWNVEMLEAPYLVGFFESSIPSIDHNLYVMGQHCYQANYTGGLRVLRLNSLEPIDIEEVAYYDIIPEHNNVQFTGSWNAYPFFPSGTIILSNMMMGMHILQPDFDVATSIEEEELADEKLLVYPNPARYIVRVRGVADDAGHLTLFNLAGQLVWQQEARRSHDSHFEIPVSGLPVGMYLLRAGTQSARIIVQ